MLINQRVYGDWSFLTSIQSLQREHEMVENEHENIKLTGRRWSESGGGASKEGNGTNRFHGGAGAALFVLVLPQNIRGYDDTCTTRLVVEASSACPVPDRSSAFLHFKLILHASISRCRNAQVAGG